MIRYKHYEVYALYSHNSQIGTENNAFHFHVQGEKHMHEYLKYGTGWERMELVEDSAPAHHGAVIRFHNTVRTAFDKITSTAVGRYVLEAIKPNQKVYIIPRPLKRHVAQTEKVGEMGGGGIRVRLNPEDWPTNFDDTLLHELVHAVRLSFDRLMHKRLGDPNFEDVEEYMATQVSNIYRSAIGKTGFYDRYPELEGKWASMGSVYSTMIETPLLIMGLKYCHEQEDFIRKISALPVNLPPFNPFRDYNILERKALGRLQATGYSAGKFSSL